MDTIFIIRLGRLGDVVLTGPTIKNLRFLYPQSKMIFITRQMYRPLAEMLFGVDETLIFPDNGSYLDLVKLSSRLNKYKPDLVVDLHKNFRSFHLANISGAKYKVVYKKRRKQRQAAVNDKKFISPIPHTTDQYNLIIDQLKGERIARRPDLHLSYSSLHDRENVRFGISMAPGSGSPVKSWPTEKFASVAERIITDFKIPVDLLLSPKEKELEKYFSSLPDEFLRVHNNISIPEIAQIMSKSQIGITNDSGLMHISSSVGTPTIALFGPTHEQLGFYPLGLHDLMLATEDECRPCSLHGNKECFQKKQYCFINLSVDLVYEKAAEKLESDKLNQAVFVDRDGTLIVDKNYLADPEKIEFIPGAVDAVRDLKFAGYKIIIISNQSGVARGFFPEETVQEVNNRLHGMLSEKGVDIDDISYCPYHPDGDIPEYTKDMPCRKPWPGMLEEAAIKHNIDLKRSFMIGDKLSDVQCGQAAGAIPILVRTGKGAKAETDFPSSPYPQPYYICDNLAEAGNKILDRL